jgi:hypothetical protein
MGTLGLKARGGIGKYAVAVEPVSVAGTGSSIRHQAGEIAGAFGCEGNGLAALDHYLHSLSNRSPNSKVDSGIS